MAEQQRQTILQALRAVHAVSTSHEDRARAGQYLESFKSSPSGADAAVVFFEKSSCEDVELRHFCLHSINDALKSQWNTWQQNRKDLLKRKIFSFASSHLNDILVGPKVIRETISSLLAELAKREWPQLWPSFCNDILGLINTNYTEAYVGIRALHLLAQDACSSEFNTCMPTKRRNQVLQGINKHLPVIIKSLYIVLNQQYSIFNSDRSAKKAEILIVCALECLGVFVEWMQIDSCFEPGCNLLEVFSVLIKDSSHPIRMASAKAMTGLCNRKAFTDASKITASEAVMLVMRTCAALPLDAQFPVDEDLYKFQQQIAKLICCIGEIHLQCFQPSDPVVVLCVEISSRMFQHPSYKITERMLGTWYYILERLNGFITAKCVADRIPWLISLYGQKVLRHGSPEDPIETPVSQYGIFDFDDNDEFLKSLGVCRSRITSAIKALAGAYPTIVVEYIRQRMAEVLQSFPRSTNALREGTPYGTIFSTAYIQLEGATICLEKILGAFNAKMTAANGLSNGGGVSTGLHKILEMLVNYKTDDPLLLGRQMIGLSTFSKGGYFKNHDQSLGFVLEKLFSSTIFQTPLELQRKTGLGDLHNDTKSARRKAMVALIKIAMRVPAKMLPNFPNIINRVLELINTSQIMDSEKALLYEMMVIVSNSISVFEEQKSFLDNMMEAPLRDWTMDASTSLVSSPQAFIAMLRSSSADTRWKIYSCLQIFSCVGKRSHAKAARSPQQNGAPKIHPFIHNWSLILPNIFALVKTLHQIWEPPIREPLEKSDMCWLQRISPLEVRVAMGFEDHFLNIPGVHQSEVALATGVSNSEENGADLASLMTHLRRECYDLIKIAAIHSASMQNGKISYLQNPLGFMNGFGGIFDIQNLHSLMLQNIFVGLNSMEHRHLKMFMSIFLNPFSLTCPLPLVPTLLFPLLHPFMQHLTGMLNKTWESWYIDPAQRVPWHFPMGMDPDVKLMVDERLIREVSREYLTLLRALFPQKPLVKRNGKIVKQVGAPSPAYLTKLGELLVADARMKEQVIYALSSAFLWPDTKCLRSTLLLAERILPFLTKHVENHGMLSHLLASALQVLLTNKDHGKIHQNFLIALINSMYCRMSFGWIPVHEGGGNSGMGVHGSSNEARRIVSLIPGVSESEIKEFDSKLLNSKQSEREKRGIVQSFLQDCALKMGQTGDTKESILVATKFSIQNLATSTEPFDKKKAKATNDTLSNPGLVSLFQ